MLDCTASQQRLQRKLITIEGGAAEQHTGTATAAQLLWICRAASRHHCLVTSQEPSKWKRDKFCSSFNERQVTSWKCRTITGLKAELQCGRSAVVMSCPKNVMLQRKMQAPASQDFRNMTGQTSYDTFLRQEWGTRKPIFGREPRLQQVM